MLKYNIINWCFICRHWSKLRFRSKTISGPSNTGLTKADLDKSASGVCPQREIWPEVNGTHQLLIYDHISTG
jgi:hypothetical protein